jgi:soluble cytochrome b562
MKTKHEIMSRMLELQKQFIEKEHQDGIDTKEYFNPTNDPFMKQYREEYDELARQLVQIAHAEKGSKP